MSVRKMAREMTRKREANQPIDLFRFEEECRRLRYERDEQRIEMLFSRVPDWQNGQNIGNDRALDRLELIALEQGS